MSSFNANEFIGTCVESIYGKRAEEVTPMTYSQASTDLELQSRDLMDHVDNTPEWQAEMLAIYGEDPGDESTWDQYKPSAYELQSALTYEQYLADRAEHMAQYE
jgi:hypothetical protein